MLAGSIGAYPDRPGPPRRRAESVLERLATVHGVARDQLETGGVAYLSPIASNLTAGGREANRRVEAVLLNTE